MRNKTILLKFLTIGLAVTLLPACIAKQSLADDILTAQDPLAVQNEEAQVNAQAQQDARDAQYEMDANIAREIYTQVLADKNNGSKQDVNKDVTEDVADEVAETEEIPEEFAEGNNGIAVFIVDKSNNGTNNSGGVTKTEDVDEGNNGIAQLIDAGGNSGTNTKPTIFKPIVHLPEDNNDRFPQLDDGAH